ncbi:hypothetical protein [Sulfurimonas sp. HSL-1716]|uniref:hypothetical protein n=1 Tax=Hydrocurvibacter sulfurireducens TaxID=3131937 RepID=UPI0031F9D0AA
MEINTLLPIFTAIVGSYLTYFFTSRSKREEAILKYKEEKYANLLVLLQGFVGLTATTETKRKFFEEQYRSWIYSSDEVVLAVNKMIKLVIDSKGNNPDLEEGRKAIGNIVLSMRKDLKGKTNLTYKDFTYIDVR